MQNGLSIISAAFVLAAATATSAFAMPLPRDAARADRAAVQMPRISASATTMKPSRFHKAAFHVGIIHSYP